jgi:hypothetical protein
MFGLIPKLVSRFENLKKEKEKRKVWMDPWPSLS